MIDTHCHLNFSRFKKNVDEVIASAKQSGITHIVIPGTDVPTSKKAIEVATQNENIFAAVGIHPHHVYDLKLKEMTADINAILKELEGLVTSEKVVAIGEIGMDKHVYEDTKYEQYNVDETFLDLQKILLTQQIKLAVKYNKSLILHNREAKSDLLPIVEKEWNTSLERRAVLHCCEPDEELLEFAKSHKLFLGVDGDITHFPEKQEFIKKIPLEMLVLETDSPFLLPEPYRTQKLFPNKPENLIFIGKFIAEKLGITFEELDMQTTQNAKELFQIS